MVAREQIRAGRKRRRNAVSLTIVLLASSALPSEGFVSLHSMGRRPIMHQAQSHDSLRSTKEADDMIAESTDTDATKGFSRRQALQGIMGIATATLPVSAAWAGKPEVDKFTGSLYTPKAVMLSGGSAAARGITVSDTRPPLQPGKALQTVYNPRFIAYLSRFLLNFDPAANTWWLNNFEEGTDDSVLPKDTVQTIFAEFAESVEIGLADYFVGPYGSYSNLSAMKAGLSAAKPAKSSRANDPRDNPFGIFGMSWDDLFMEPIEKDVKLKDREVFAKQGVLNLYTLLKARYTSEPAKRQLSILFSFIESSNLQPTAEIQSLLGEADNGSITKIELFRSAFSDSEVKSRSSSRRGGGYAWYELPAISIEPPPALGSDYKRATATSVMSCTSRVLRISVEDGGENYQEPPDVTVNGISSRSCSATAILDRSGHVESIFVLDSGFGYGKNRNEVPPKVVIAPPKGGGRRATAFADLEYEISDISVAQPGNGYVPSEPPQVTIQPPDQDPDWYFITTEEAVAPIASQFPIASVAEMLGSDGKVLCSSASSEKSPRPSSLHRLMMEPLSLLSSSIRPVRDSVGLYTIPPVAEVQTYDSSPNPRFRAVDPIFGAIGTVPVTKTAMELKPSEYARLAASGAICTVLVRTALNPLELIKTKQQLKNDKDLLEYTAARVKSKTKDTETEIGKPKLLPKVGKTQDKDEQEVGAFDLIAGLSALRGPSALFQSADITFLASLVFGSFGFGATELFRRSFTMVFFTGNGTDSGNSELILLLAATVATIITSFAAAPFELLRVRSMGVVGSKKWVEVLGDFLAENSRVKSAPLSNSQAPQQQEAFQLKDVEPKDLAPLWAGFPPTVSRELAFAIPKFLVFDILAGAIAEAVNTRMLEPGSLPVQAGVGTTGLCISAISGALAGIAGAIVSHPADLILTYTSASGKSKDGSKSAPPDWKAVVADLLSRDGGITNLFIGLAPRLVFFFLVIGLQFFLYDYGKNLLNVGSDDLSLVLDVFYAIRQGLMDMTEV